MLIKRYKKDAYDLPADTVKIVLEELFGNYGNLEREASQPRTLIEDVILQSSGADDIRVQTNNISRPVERATLQVEAANVLIDTAARDIKRIDMAIRRAAESCPKLNKTKQLEEDLRKNLLYNFRGDRTSILFLSSSAETVTKYRKIAIYFCAVYFALHVPKEGEPGFGEPLPE